MTYILFLMDLIEILMDLIEKYSTVSTFLAAVIFYMFYTRRKDMEKLEEEKPRIFVDPHWKWLEHNYDQGLGSFGRIIYLDIRNVGRGLATKVVIRVYGFKEYGTLSQPTEIGFYKMEYLPPEHHEKYHLPNIRSVFFTGEFPQKIKISYFFRGKPMPDDTHTLFPEKREDRGHELEIYTGGDE